MYVVRLRRAAYLPSFAEVSAYSGAIRLPYENIQRLIR